LSVVQVHGKHHGPATQARLRGLYCSHPLDVVPYNINKIKDALLTR